jgi:benzoyl-CoA reductase subunit A
VGATTGGATTTAMVGMATSNPASAQRDYWRWSDTAWQAPETDWRGASVVAVGIDVGSVSSQAVLLADGRPLSYYSTRTGSSSPDSALRVFKGASEAVGVTLDDVNYCVGTGYGRVNVPFAQRTITEIACHARGANHMAGSGIRTILDMGGQDCKVIHCDERGKVLNFIMNDKCAAGTGRGMEVIADVLSVPIEDIGRRSFEIDEEPPPVSNVCTVFAKSEATTLLRAGWSVNRVLVEAVRPPSDSGLDPQIAGALGAALFAHSLYRKENRDS